MTRIRDAFKSPCALAALACALTLPAAPVRAFTTAVTGHLVDRACGLDPKDYDDGGVGFISASGFTPLDPVPPPDCQGNGRADSSASQSHAQLKAYAEASGPFIASATAEIEVLVHLMEINTQGPSVISDTWDIDVTGSTTPLIGGAVTSSWGACLSVRLNTGQVIQSPGCAATVIGSGGPFARTETLSYTAPANNGRVDITLRILIFANAFGLTLSETQTFMGVANLADTVSVRYTPPPGWTFTSDSGVFLSAVPEPAPATSMAFGGVLLMAWQAWRRRRHAVR